MSLRRNEAAIFVRQRGAARMAAGLLFAFVGLFARADDANASSCIKSSFDQMNQANMTNTCKQTVLVTWCIDGGPMTTIDCATLARTKGSIGVQPLVLRPNDTLGSGGGPGLKLKWAACFAPTKPTAWSGGKFDCK